MSIINDDINWFESLFGFRETPQNIHDFFECDQNENDAILISKKSQKRFPAGNFKICDILSFNNLTPRYGGHLHIIHGNGIQSNKLFFVDVMSAQNHPDFNGATFQAASNFNCLEPISGKQSASAGITMYIKDRTQGPTCAVSAGVAVAYRNYFVLHSDGTIGQLQKEVELLNRTPLKVVHGYVKIDKNECERLKKLNFNWSNLENYQIGVHQNCRITLNRTKNGIKINKNTDQITHQIFCAALSFNTSVISNSFTHEISAQILKAEYRATILAAWQNSIEFPDLKGSKKCFLTLVGGGVFHNRFENICNAINECKDIIEQSGLDVYVVCFNSTDFKYAYPHLKKTVDATGGSVIRA